VIGPRKAVAAVRAVRAFAALVRDPTRLDQVFALADAAMDEATRDAMLANVRRHAQGRAALAERPRLTCPDLGQLARLPAGTLGHAYAAHLHAAGLDPSKLPQRATPDERSYLLAHIYETHDVWHTVTGFATDVAGELGLMAFYAAQGPSKGPLAILTAGLVNTMRGHMDDKDRRLDAITRGWTLGRRAAPLFGVRWADRWSEPLADLRRRFALDLEPSDVLPHRADQQQPPPHLPLPAA
jgi:ubiquinone biosynthesis protein Coq4